MRNEVKLYMLLHRGADCVDAKCAFGHLQGIFGLREERESHDPESAPASLQLPLQTPTMRNEVKLYMLLHQGRADCMEANYAFSHRQREFLTHRMRSTSRQVEMETRIVESGQRALSCPRPDLQLSPLNNSRTNGGFNRLALGIKHFEKQKPRPAVDTMPNILRVDSPGSLLVHLSSRVDQWTLVHRPSYVTWVKTPHWAPTFALKDRGVVFENYACTCSIQINE
ncbi:hypothetical protein K438DRAFT_202538 [Mycena galopus ATCC 62051]|nr:hypothetical protein K438DRAFT_202538 [Mycena galopus ATCC 62051]